MLKVDTLTAMVALYQVGTLERYKGIQADPLYDVMAYKPDEVSCGEHEDDILVERAFLEDFEVNGGKSHIDAVDVYFLLKPHNGYNNDILSHPRAMMVDGSFVHGDSQDYRRIFLVVFDCNNMSQEDINGKTASIEKALAKTQFSVIAPDDMLDFAQLRRGVDSVVSQIDRLNMGVQNKAKVVLKNLKIPFTYPIER